MALDIRRKIEKAIAEDGTVLFIGAGISTWSGIPGWGRLLNDMADFVDGAGGDSAGIRKYKDSQPLVAADLAKKELDKEQYYGFLKQEMRLKTSKPGEIHQLLLNLGVNCFITTNFDQLLERAIRANGKSGRFQVVTNTDVQKCADLCAIKSRNFIFKPHGDIRDADSIILTNSDYCNMYENGGRYYAHRTLDTLLATRNVIFIGFGLTDPDFLRIMDRFRNDYKQSIVEKYAIMPDVSGEEADYWRETYGIHILSYGTVLTENGRDYSSIFKVLRELAPAGKKSGFSSGGRKEAGDTVTAKQRRALAVYAQSVMANFKIDQDTVFPLEMRRSEYGGWGRPVSTEDMLQMEERGYTLTGSPGSGKTFFMKRYCAAQAGRLLDWCRSSRRRNMPLIPVYIDLKHYSGVGSIGRMIEEQFPDEALVRRLLDDGRVLYMLDSYNEIESRYTDDAECCRDVAMFLLYKDAIVASRTGTRERSYKNYKLEAVEESYVKEYLCGKGLGSLTDHPVIMGIFRTPLYFQLLRSGRINVEEASTANDIYHSYFRYLNRNIRERFGIRADVIPMLRNLAFELFDRGAETFLLEDISDCVEHKVPEYTERQRKELLNFLMDRLRFLIPLPEGKAMFFHQSVTEYLAAAGMACRGTWRQALNEHLDDLRWNQVFLFAAGFYDGEEAAEYIEALLKADSLLAAQAAEYVREGTKQCTMLVLEHLYRQSDSKLLDYYIQLEEAYVRLPVTGQHEEILRRLMEKGNLLGGIAGGWLLSVCGNEVKDEMIRLIFRHCRDDFNFVTRIAGVLRGYITEEDYKKIVIGLHDYEDGPEDGLFGFSELAYGFSLEQVAGIFENAGELNHVQRQVLAEILGNEGSRDAFEMCLNRYLDGWDEMLFSLYRFVWSDDVPGEAAGAALVDRLMRDIGLGKERWAVGLLYALYHKSDAAAKYVRSRLKYTSGVVRLAFYYVIGKNRTKSFFSSFISMLYWEELPDGMVDAFGEADWTDYAGSVVRVLYEQGRTDALARFLDSLEGKADSLHLDAGMMSILLTVLKSCDDCGIRYAVGKFTGEHADRDALLRLYYLMDSGVRTWMRFYVLPYVGYLKREDFPEEEIQLMLDDLRKYDLDEDIVYSDELLLVNISDGAFVEDVLEPMMGEDGEIVLRNVRMVLEKAGEAHGKRYVGR